MTWKALRKGLSLAARVAVVLLVLCAASPAWGRTSAYEDEDDASKYWNPWVVPYVLTVSLTGGVLFVVWRSSRRNPL